MADKQPTDKKTDVKKTPKKTPKAEQATSEPKEAVIVQEKNRGWNVGALFWGLLLIAVGGLLLLGNLGLVDVQWSELWRLWPLLIVAAGFSVLAATHWVWKILSLVFVVAAVLAVIWVGTGQYSANSSESAVDSVSIEADQEVTKADVTLRAGASKISIDSSDMSDIARAKLTSDVLSLSETSTREGDTQVIEFASQGERMMWFGPQQNTWDVTLSERLPMQLEIDAGASSIDADLSSLQLTELIVKAGASSTVITLGDKVDELMMDIDSGASSTTLRIPQGSGVKIKYDGGLSSRNFEGLKEVSDGEYQSDDFDTATKTIIIDADAGLASFKIERY